MNILLTGSGGFIGKNIKIFLREKYQLLTPRYVDLDLCDSNAVKNYFSHQAIDFIIHCAAIGGKRGQIDEKRILEANLGMVRNLLQEKNEETKMIILGSGALYDRNRLLHKVCEKEMGTYAPSDYYGLSKLKIGQTVFDRKDVLYLILFGCYGEGESETRFPSYAISQVIKEEDIVIEKNTVFDYLWIGDLLNILDYFIAHWPSNKILNITPSISSSMLEIAQIAREIGQSNINIKVKNKEGGEYTGSNQELLKAIPGFSFTSIQEGLLKLYKTRWE